MRNIPEKDWQQLLNIMQNMQKTTLCHRLSLTACWKLLDDMKSLIIDCLFNKRTMVSLPIAIMQLISTNSLAQ